MTVNCRCNKMADMSIKDYTKWILKVKYVLVEDDGEETTEVIVAGMFRDTMHNSTRKWAKNQVES
jgi:hypothetical protein